MPATPMDLDAYEAAATRGEFEDAPVLCQHLRIMVAAARLAEAYWVAMDAYHASKGQGGNAEAQALEDLGMAYRKVREAEA